MSEYQETSDIRVYNCNQWNIIIRENKGFITGITITENKDSSAIDYKGQIPEIQIIESCISDIAFRQIKEYINGQRISFDLPLKIEGSEFQKKVWSSLLKIPYGEVTSYGELSEIVTGSKKSSRAIGGALNRNPFHIVIPCHRVIGNNGKLTGFRAGINVKEDLLLLEKENIRKFLKTDII